MLKRSIFFLMLIVWGILPSVSKIHRNESPANSPVCSIIILGEPGDPYYPLAQEIAQQEGAILIHSLNEALPCQPTFLLWVSSPHNITERELIKLGLFQFEYARSISTGIITGSTIQKARDLWLRFPPAFRQLTVAVNAANPSAGITSGRIRVYRQSELIEEKPLDKRHLINAMTRANHLSFTGGGGNSFWILDPDDRIKLNPEDIPLLTNIAISSGSCQTLQPWKSRSISLRFIDQGALVYAGFFFSPNEGYLIGEFNDLPFRYTWPEFPIGHVVQVQNRGIQQGFATFPYYQMLGDPRVSIQTEAQYDLVDDRQAGADRIIKIAGAPAGLIPIVITNGATYSFVSVPGNTAAGENDPFYNSRLQMANIQNDKFILLVHSGGDISLHLQHQPPWYWHLTDPILDSLDHTLLFIQQKGTGGDVIPLVVGVLSIVFVVVILKHHPQFKRLFVIAMITGLVFTTIHVLYYSARVGAITITSKQFELSPWAVIATGLLFTSGSCIFWTVRSRKSKFLALLIPTFPAWFIASFTAPIIAFMGVATNQKTGLSIWNFALAEMPLLVFSIQLPLITALFVFIEKKYKKTLPITE